MPRHNGPSGSLKCDVPGCRDPKTFSKRGLALHKRFAHGIEGKWHQELNKQVAGPSSTGGPFKCDLCAGGFNTPQALGLHKRLIHGVRGTQRAGGAFRCPLCSKSFRAQHGLSLHTTLKHKDSSNGKTSVTSVLPSLGEAIAALEIKRDALQWVIEDLKRIALAQ